MRAFDLPDWGGVFVPDGSLVESFVRGTAVYFAVLVMLRVVLRRQAGGMGLSDVLLVVLVSECVSPALSAETRSVPNGLAALTALLVWSYALDWATDRWKWLRRHLDPPSVELVRDGAKLSDALRKQHVTDDELMSQLRLNGVDDLARVKVVTLEPDGEISVVTRDAPAPEPTPPEAGDPPNLDEALKRFLAAAGDVRAAVAWHDDRAAAHRRAAAEARAALVRHGVRPRPRPSPNPEPAT
jgi:uncharacterized membrane protein YcaP (DUF421 family)